MQGHLTFVGIGCLFRRSQEAERVRNLAGSVCGHRRSKLKAGNVAKAKKSFEAFNDNWDNIEDLVKARSRESYDAIEKGMVTIERQLMPAKPDVDATTATVTGVMTEYNKIVTQITKEARDAK